MGIAQSVLPRDTRLAKNEIPKKHVFFTFEPRYLEFGARYQKTLQWDSALVFWHQIPLFTFPTRYLCRAGKVELHLQNR